LNALGFYQKRGFEIVTIYRGAVHESRKIKPSIPLVGYNNIPLRDEIELEIPLKV
jgi:DNA-3-methyladenine glycosylase I